MKIITSVGTSLITNYLNPEKNNYINTNFKSLFKDKLQNIEFSEKSWKSLQNDIYFNQFKEKLLGELNQKGNSCAEKSTLDKIANKNDEIYLLTTDTIDGYFVGNILAEYYNVNSEYLVKITGLQVHNPDKFKDEGINNLIEIIKEIKDKNNDVILNISGGYKALIPILTIIGQIENIPLKYIYEDSEELIEIPDLQIDFDFTFIEEYYNAFELLKKQDRNLPSKQYFLKIIGDNDVYDKWINNDKIIEEFLYDETKKIKFSFIGKLIFHKYEELYNKKLLHRQNLVSKLVEMYLYKYCVKQYGSKVIAGKFVGDKNYDIDVYIETEDFIRAIEVKPGGHIPTKDILKVFKEKSFNWLINKNPNTKLIVQVVLYHYKQPLKHVIENIRKEVESIVQNKHCKVIFTWLKLEPNYKTNMNWEVSNERLVELFEINNHAKTK